MSRQQGDPDFPPGLLRADTALRNPLMGLKFEEEASDPFEREATDALTLDYSPSQPRDRNGRWTADGGSGKIGKTRYAPSQRANKTGITLSPKTFGILRGEFNTKFPAAAKGEQGQVSYRGRRYLLEADGDGSAVVLSSWKER